MSNLSQRLSPIPQYLLGPFHFPGELSAPLATPYTEQGAKGSLTLVQNDGQFGLSGEKLTFSVQNTPAWNDEDFYSPVPVARVPGRTLLSKAVQTTLGNAIVQAFVSTISGSRINNGLSGSWFLANGGLCYSTPGAISQLQFALYTSNTEFEFATVLRSTGLFLLVRGGSFTNWTLAWVVNVDSTASLFPLFQTFSGVGIVDNFRIVDLGGLWADDYGIAIQRLAGPRTAGDGFTHNADCLIEYVATAITGSGYAAIEFRRQDANNLWDVEIPSGGTLRLYEKVAGVYTLRGEVVAIVSAGHRVVVVADGTTIKVYSNNVLRITYSSATNFQTATSGLLERTGSGAISDLVTWPRTVNLPPGV